MNNTKITRQRICLSDTFRIGDFKYQSAGHHPFWNFIYTDLGQIYFQSGQNKSLNVRHIFVLFRVTVTASVCDVSIFSFPLFSCSLLIFMVLASLATTVPRSFLDSLEILFFLLHLVEGVLLEALIFLLSFLLKTLVFLLSEFGMCTIARRIDGRWISSSRKRICNFHYFFIPNIVYRLPWKLLPIIQVDEFFWWLFFKVCNLSMSSFMASIRKPRSFSYWWFQNRGPRLQRCRSFFLRSFDPFSQLNFAFSEFQIRVWDSLFGTSDPHLHSSSVAGLIWIVLLTTSVQAAR